MSMPYNLPQRKSPRATWHDYNGANYFITICTKNHELYFGDVVDGRMELSEIGEWTVKQIEQTAIIRQNDVEIPLYVVMPNHIHLIVVYNNAHGGRTRCVPTIWTAIRECAIGDTWYQICCHEIRHRT